MHKEKGWGNILKVAICSERKAGKGKSTLPEHATILWKKNQKRRNIGGISETTIAPLSFRKLWDEPHRPEQIAARVGKVRGRSCVKNRRSLKGEPTAKKEWGWGVGGGVCGGGGVLLFGGGWRGSGGEIIWHDARDSTTSQTKGGGKTEDGRPTIVRGHLTSYPGEKP